MSNSRRARIVLSSVLIAVIGAIIAAPTTGWCDVDPDEIRQPEGDNIQIVRTKDGSTFIGRITEVKHDVVIFRTDVGEITIPIARIDEIREVAPSAMEKGSYWFPDPSTTRLYLFPTARMTPRGDGYFANYYVFFAAAGYGATDWLTLGAGMSLFPSVDFNRQLYFFTPKVGFGATEKLDISAGALLLKIPGFDDDDDVPMVGVLESVVTYGSDATAVTAGVGYGFVDDEMADKPLVLLGVSKRFTRRMVFISENWIIPGVDDAMISYGIRFLGEKISVDLAFFSPTGDDFIFPGIPFVAFAFNF